MDPRENRARLRGLRWEYEEDLSRILGVPVSYFYSGAEDDEGSAGLAAAGILGQDPMSRRETMELVRVYYRIRDPVMRRRIFELAKALARLSGGEPEKT